MKKNKAKFLATVSTFVLVTASTPMFAMAAGAEITPCSLNACVDHDWFYTMVDPYYTFIDGDQHHVWEDYERYCANEGCGIRDIGVNEYYEPHFYDYNYDTNYWECACGDSYQHN